MLEFLRARISAQLSPFMIRETVEAENANIDPNHPAICRKMILCYP
jgi:hypothetical protein